MTSTRIHRRIELLAAVGLLVCGAAAVDPYLAYRDANPEVGEEDLLDVQAGDSLERVLAVLHHPHAGFDTTAVRVWRNDGAGLAPVPLPEVLAAEERDGSLLAAVTQRCSRAPDGAGGPPFSSWFLLQRGRLRAWSLQAYGPDCRLEDPLVDASDHDAMREVGRALFARARKGPFRYGPLVYEEWDDAFASPTPESMLSRLQDAASARPHDAHAQNRLAVGRYATGERKVAVAALERAMHLAPSWPVPHRNLAVAYRQRGDLAAAAEARAQADWLLRTASSGSRSF